MKKNITVDKRGCVKLEEFADIIPIEKVKYYKVTNLEKGGLTVKFYDKNKKVIKPHVPK